MKYTKQYGIMIAESEGGENVEKNLGERVLEFRARHGMSQEDFANLVQVNVMTINAIENDKRKPLKTTAMKIEMILREDAEK